jgi:hypothetical protein
VTLISVAIGLGLAVAYYAAFLWFQLFIGKRASTLAPALTVAGFVVRLTVFAAILIMLGLFTKLNIIATVVAFVVLYTILSAFGMYHYVAKAKRDKEGRGAGPEGGSLGG